jgi:hypothetical protein
MHHQAAGAQAAILINLRAAQDKDMLEPEVLVKRHTATRMEMNKGRGRTVLALAIKPMNEDAGKEQMPIKAVLVLEQLV